MSDTTVQVCVCVCCMLYGCESWVLYQHLVRKLDEFHMRCLSRIAGIKWQDRVPNTEVLHSCGITGIEAFVLQAQTAQFRWVGHVVRMQDDHISKQILYGQISSGKRPQCGPVRRYKDTVRDNLKSCGGIHPQSLVSVPLDTDSGVRRVGQPSPLLRKHGLPVCRGNGQPVSTRSSAAPTRHGRVIGATKSVHPELGFLPIVVSVDEAVRRT